MITPKQPSTTQSHVVLSAGEVNPVALLLSQQMLTDRVDEAFRWMSWSEEIYEKHAGMLERQRQELHALQLHIDRLIQHKTFLEQQDTVHHVKQGLIIPYRVMVWGAILSPIGALVSALLFWWLTQPPKKTLPPMPW